MVFTHRRPLAGLLAAATIAVAACGGGAASPAATTAPAESAAASSTDPGASQPAAELEGNITFLHKYSDPRYAPYFEGVVKSYMDAHPKSTRGDGSSSRCGRSSPPQCRRRRRRCHAAWW